MIKNSTMAGDIILYQSNQIVKFYGLNDGVILD